MPPKTFRRRQLLLGLPIVIAVLFGPAPAPVQAGFLNDVGSALGAAGNAIQTGLGGIGTAIQGGVSSILNFGGGLIGGSITSAFDPLIDHFSDALQKAGDNIVDHAASTFQGVADQEITKVDKLAQDRIVQVAQIVDQTLDKVNQQVQADLAKVDAITQQFLDREAAIIADALTREDSIVDRSLQDIDAIADRSLTRVEQLESDAFQKIEVAALDQAPVATRLIIQQVLYAAIAIVFLVVLVGHGGTILLRRATARYGAKGGLARQLTATLDFLPNQFVTVAIPMLLVTGLILGGYYGYVWVDDELRLMHMRDGALALERSGNFAAAASLRKRVANLLPSDDGAQFMARRDLWLANFNAPQPVANGDLRLASLMALQSSYADSPKIQARAEADPELGAVALYLAERTLRERSAANTGPLMAMMDAYLTQYETDKTIVLRRLVYMAKIRLILDNGARDFRARLLDAQAVAGALVRQYPSYAPAYAVRAQLDQIWIDAEAYRPTPAQDLDQRRSESARDTASIGLYDPGLLKLIQLAYFTISQSDAEALKLGVNAVKEKVNVPQQEAANATLDRIRSTFTDQAQTALGSAFLARREASAVLPLLIVRTLKQAALKNEVFAARRLLGSNTQAAYDACLRTAQSAQAAQQYIAAEEWAGLAVKIQTSLKLESAKPEEVSAEIRKVPISHGLAFVY